MTSVVESTVREGVLGQLKVIAIQSSDACATGHTIDLDSDVADGRDRRMKTILNVIVQDDAGADKDCTWDPDTGIITLGTLSTGVHNILIFGL